MGYGNKAVTVNIGSTGACIGPLDRIVRPDIPEHGDVDVASIVGATIAVEDFTHGLQLARVDRASAHEFVEAFTEPGRRRRIASRDLAGQ